ncbi:hypothetical protein, partial [Pseudomonas sp. AH2 (2023)]|uniref:hypothetical protein n=1 Tax=Pseudomonas sp. AH2 (2023) TaxID=3048599 RepID=UPI002B239511
PMTQPTTLVFLDLETTGLDPKKHDIWEAAWAVGETGPIKHSFLEHDLHGLDPGAAKVNGYFERYAPPTTPGGYANAEL